MEASLMFTRDVHDIVNGLDVVDGRVTFHHVSGGVNTVGFELEGFFRLMVGKPAC